MFKGFESPNFTQIPNEYLDYTLSTEFDLSALEMRIMNFFFRETYGWHEKTAQLVASVTDFQAIFNIQKRKTITDALDRLTNVKQFLQSVQVKQLPERSRKNIQKVVNKTLHPAQKLYRLNLSEYQGRPWDNVRNWQTTDTKERKQDFLLLKREKQDKSEKSNGYQSVPINGYQSVPINGYQSVPINGYQSVPISEAETLEPVSVSESLNKGLNKDLNKDLNKTYLSSIEKSNMPDNIKHILNTFVDRLVSDSIDILDIENHFFSNVDKTVNKYEYAEVLSYYLKNARGRIESISALLNIGVSKYLEMQSEKLNKSQVANKNSVKPTRTELLPEWFEEQNNNIDLEPSEKTPVVEEKEYIQEKRRLLNEKLKKLKG